MHIDVIRVYVWSQTLALIATYKINVEELDYVEINNVVYRGGVTSNGVFLFIDVTEHLNTLPHPKDVISACNKLGLKYNNIYNEWYSSFKMKKLLYPSLKLINFILGS